MEALEVPERTRKRIVALLAEDRARGGRLLARLKELRSLEGVPVFAAVMHLLAHLDLAEENAESLMGELIEHRRRMRADLRRDPGLRVAAIDFLSNVKKLLGNPTIVELSELEITERSAVTDPLTGLYNRRYFDSCLEIEVRRSRRYALPLSLLMLDLDSFKAVNDLYGHPFGDLVLQQAGLVLRRAVRESDVACRFGGEEFAIILPETDRLGAHAVAERVRLGVERTFGETPIGDRAVAMTISGGVATFPEDGSDASVLISWADQALYQSKARGRNRITLYHAERRGSVRYPARRSARAGLASRARDAMGPVHVVNLSRGGALLETPSDYEPSETVRLTWADRVDEWVVPGRVVRVEQGGDPTGNRRVAVAFDEPLPEECLRRCAVRGRGRTETAGSRIEP